MIIKASKRGGSRQLGVHLMNPENEHIQLLGVEGCSSDSLTGGLNEMYAVSRATKAKKFMLHLVFNPPEGEEVSIEMMEGVVIRAKSELGLAGQPHCLVAHEKEGRRHFHCVISLINADEMKAIKVPYFKKRMNGLAKTLFLENNWNLPEGFKNQDNSDPRNFTLAEWQQAKRHGLSPKVIKTRLQECWAISDSKASFTHALNEAGYFLAQGDRRGYVAVDWHGEVYSLTRALGVKTKEVKGRLGDYKQLPTVQDTGAAITTELRDLHKRFACDLAAKHKDDRQPFRLQKNALVKAQRMERAQQTTVHSERSTAEAKSRQAHFRKGLLGAWDFITGTRKRQTRHNEREAMECAKRDTTERETMINEHLNQRQTLKARYQELRGQHQEEKLTLNAGFVQSIEGVLPKDELTERFNIVANPDVLRSEPKADSSPDISL